MNEKICANCGAKLPGEVNFCPYCQCASFNPIQKAKTGKKERDPIHWLLYWKYDSGYVLSKSKLAGVLTFLVISISGIFTPFFAGVVFLGLIIGVIVFLVGFVGHMIKSKPTENRIKNNDSGVLTDLVHLFFYWQNKNTGEYVISKTKVITALVFVICTVSSVSMPAPSLFACVLFGLFFAVPTYAVGFAVHKLTNDNPTKKIAPEPEKEKIEPKVKPEKVEPKEEKIIEKQPQPETSGHEERLNWLRTSYMAKDEKARELIEKRFEPPQLTYTRFISVVDQSKSVFEREAGEISDIISIADEQSPRIEEELNSKFGVLQSISDRMDDLIDELVLSFDDKSDDDIGNLDEEMENLISSLKDYE